MIKNRQLTVDFIADQYLPIFKANPHWKAKEIQEAVKEKFKVIISNWMAYKAKSSAHMKLHGSMKEHYSKLGSYVEALKEVNPTSTFELGFLAGCRRLLCLDGCFLKTFLGGMLLAAIGRDVNDQMYPVAWAVVEGENNDSWTWFMNELKKCLGVDDDGKGWTLVSDQQKGLVNAVAEIWNNAEHRNCARHIYRAARSYSVSDYNKAIVEIRELNADAAEAFIIQNPKCFCRCFLNTETKADVIVNNMAETFNGYILHYRSKHIINMLEDIRVSVMTRLVNKQNEMARKNVFVCPRIQLKLNKDKDRAFKCSVFPSSPTLFQVKNFSDVSVDLNNRTCTCRKWELTGIPCYHVVAGFLKMNVEELVHSCLTKEMYLKSYQFTIPPLPSEKYWSVVELPLNPPPIKIGPGRPKYWMVYVESCKGKTINKF
ncbi:uncharacterized protein LOC143616200 [Bidens hawaiensis]|uniref:uncharacterized protein LOC143616200 n=1 Tax=Bidens hawaiensis TaxID=980011 RepID=UPI0040499113